jgi:hypothetical protein
MMEQRLKSRNFQNPRKRRSKNKEARINKGLAATWRSCLFLFFDTELTVGLLHYIENS